MISRNWTWIAALSLAGGCAPADLASQADSGGGDRAEGGGGGEPEVCNGVDDDGDGAVDEVCPPPDLVREEVCGDGVDNDIDGQVDEGCGVEVCGNDEDDDGDGLADEGCPGGPPPDEVCSDGVDNDLDGDVDEGCVVEPAPAEICGNGVDDDGDGRIDDEEDCPDVPPAEEVCGNGVDDDGDGDIDEDCPDEPDECPDGHEDCGGRCVDLQSDRQHCGGCGGACGDGEQCVDGQCDPVCQPDCVGRQCGDDGCGGDCGECPDDMRCADGQCDPVCQPDCDGAECGDDGCGGDCGACDGDLECIDGRCEGAAPLDDEYEDNDTPDTAGELSLPTSLEDLRAVGDDEDWFAFEGCEGGDLTLQVGYDLNDGRLDVTVVTEGGVALGGGEVDPGQPLDVTLDDNGLYFVRVVALEWGDDGIDYSLELSLDCEEEVVDGDGDGSPADEDCNDGDERIHPGADELCDGVDNDCDETVDDGASCPDLQACSDGACEDTCALAGPVEAGGYNWYEGRVNCSCGQVCTDLGLAYDNTGTGGWALISENCELLKDEFHPGVAFRSYPSCNPPGGCHYWTGQDQLDACGNWGGADQRTAVDQYLCSCELSRLPVNLTGKRDNDPACPSSPSRSSCCLRACASPTGGSATPGRTGCCSLRATSSTPGGTGGSSG